MRGFVPSANLYTVPGELFIAAGIVGATIMPHNLFLHTSLVLTRNVDRNDVKAVRAAIRYSTVDTVVALLFALFVNAAILIVAASTFNVNGYTNIATLEGGCLVCCPPRIALNGCVLTVPLLVSYPVLADAYHLLDPILGTTAASTVFAVALLCSGTALFIVGIYPPHEHVMIPMYLLFLQGKTARSPAPSPAK
jgi:manganese transport protein